MKTSPTTGNKWRTVVKALTALIFLVGTISILKDDTNPVGMHVYEFIDTYSNTPGTANGFFAIQTDAEMCIKLEQKGQKFSAVEMTDMVPYSSLSGKFAKPGATKGSIRMENLAGDVLPLNKFAFVSQQDGTDALELTGDGVKQMYTRTSRSLCRINTRMNSCIGKLPSEKEPNLSPEKMRMIIGRWSSQKGDIIVRKTVGGEENEYEFAFAGYLRFLARKSSCFFTKELSNGNMVGLVSTTLRGGIRKDVRFVLAGDGKRLLFFNCDNTPVNLPFTRGYVTKNDL